MSRIELRYNAALAPSALTGLVGVVVVVGDVVVVVVVVVVGIIPPPGRFVATISTPAVIITATMIDAMNLFDNPVS